jgi:predicted DNA-binding transcriptional regulator AlpA
MIAHRHERRRNEPLNRRKLIYRQGAVDEEISQFQLRDSWVDPLLSSRGTREYCGDISEMTLWRWGKELNFPPPDFVILRKRYWRLSSIEHWLDSQVNAA